MAGDEYSAVGGGGKLKLKGSKVKDGRVDKSRKKTKQTKDVPGGAEDTTTATTAKPTGEGGNEGKEEGQEIPGKESSPGGNELDDEKRVIYKTDAERRHEEKRRKRVCFRILCFSLMEHTY